nr:hypothetical protein [Tanacetum cinerariifolium]
DVEDEEHIDAIDEDDDEDYGTGRGSRSKRQRSDFIDDAAEEDEEEEDEDDDEDYRGGRGRRRGAKAAKNASSFFMRRLLLTIQKMTRRRKKPRTMVNTRTDADLSAAVQNGLQTLLSQIRTEIRKEFRTSSGPSDAGGNPLPVTIHTWLECFNKQKPCSFEKATAPVDAENWISHTEKIFDVMGCEDAFKTRLVVSTLNYLMCMSYTDVAQVA